MPPLAAFFVRAGSGMFSAVPDWAASARVQSDALSAKTGIPVRSLLHFSDIGLYWDGQKFVALF
jgi:hypothetical protein